MTAVLCPPGMWRTTQHPTLVRQHQQPSKDKHRTTVSTHQFHPIHITRSIVNLSACRSPIQNYSSHLTINIPWGKLFPGSIYFPEFTCHKKQPTMVAIGNNINFLEDYFSSWGINWKVLDNSTGIWYPNSLTHNDNHLIIQSKKKTQYFETVHITWRHCSV